MSTSLKDVVARLEADVLCRCRKPYALLKPEAQAKRTAMVQRVARAFVNDDEVTITKTTTREVVLRGGCFDSEQVNCDRMSGHDPAAVDLLRTARSMKLSVRQMLKLRRHCTRAQLLETRRGVTGYVATPVVVVGPAAKRRSAACAPLADLVLHQVKLAEDPGVLVVPTGWRCIPVIMCVDACPLWRTSATRADVYVAVWPGGPAAAGDPKKWATWWVMTGADDRAWLCGMDQAADLNGQIEYLETNHHVGLAGGQTMGFGCLLTGDRKGMQVSNHSPDSKCWTCEDMDSLEPNDNAIALPRWGAFLRGMRGTKGVGDYAHCDARLCNTLAKGLGSDLSAWVAARDSRGIIGRMQEVWSQLMQEAANVPLNERIALRPQKKDTFDLMSARLLIENMEYQRKVVELLKEFYPNRSVENKNLRVYTVVFSMLNGVLQLHTVWRQKTWLSDEEVSQAEQAAKELGHCWNLMGWKPTLWVHWTDAHSIWFLRKYGTMYMFSSVPTERRNSPFQTFLQSCFRCWSVRNPRMSTRGMAHILEMHALDEGLKGVPDVGEG